MSVEDSTSEKLRHALRNSIKETERLKQLNRAVVVRDEASRSRSSA